MSKKLRAIFVYRIKIIRNTYLTHNLYVIASRHNYHSVLVELCIHFLNEVSHYILSDQSIPPYDTVNYA